MYLRVFEKPERFSSWTHEGTRGRSPAPQEFVVLTSDGSFSAKHRTAGWGLVVSICGPDGVLPGGFTGCAFGPLQREIIQLNACQAQLDAYFAEVLGLLWAGIIALRLPFAGAVVFRADNQAALQGVAGQVDMKSHALCLVARNIHAAFRMLHPGHVGYQYVAGHAGDCANELADGLAGYGARTGRLCAPAEFELRHWLSNDAAAARWLPHVCLTMQQEDTMPDMRGSMITWTQEQCRPTLPMSALLQPFVRGLDLQPPSESSVEQFVVSCATYNALSLLTNGSEDGGQQDGLHGATGRISLLDESLWAHQLFLVGIQEARTPVGRSSTRHYCRYSSGCTDAHSFGVELWVAQGPDWPAHQAVVLYKDPTRLVVRVSFMNQQLHVFVGHAPHRAHKFQHRRDWWNESARICSAFKLIGDWIVLMDANCRVGSIPSRWIGSWQADLEEEIGALFHALLADLCVWLPSTFEGVMQGAGGTLLQRCSGELQRSDYVGLPGAWQSFHTCAWVAPEVTAGHSSPDHFAVVAQCCLSYCSRKKTSKVARIDPKALLDPANEETISAVIRDMPPIPWSTNVNEHAALISEYLHRQLSKRFPLKARRMRASFLSEDTAIVHREIATMRHALRNRLSALASARVRCAWIAWRESNVDYLEVLEGRWTTHVQTAIAVLGARIGELGKGLRRLCRRDKREHLQSLAASVGAVSHQELYIAVRRVLRPRKFRREAQQPLPLLKRPDETLCESLAEVQDEWRRHFAELEGGIQIGVHDLAEQCVRRQMQSKALESVDCQEIPDFEGVMRAFRQVKPLKAAGPDGLPPSICRKFASDLTTMIWPVILKTIFYRSEPIGFKGGTLFHIAKPGNAGKPFCTSDRGILAQPVLGKILHKAMRGLAIRGFEKRASELQLGGRKGMSFAMGCYCTRLFLEFARSRVAFRWDLIL